MHNSASWSLSSPPVDLELQTARPEPDAAPVDWAELSEAQHVTRNGCSPPTSAIAIYQPPTNTCRSKRSSRCSGSCPISLAHRHSRRPDYHPNRSYMDSSRLASTLWLLAIGSIAHVYPAFWLGSCPGHNGLFARLVLIALACSKAHRTDKVF